MRIKYEPSLKPLHNSAKYLFLHCPSRLPAVRTESEADAGSTVRWAGQGWRGDLTSQKVLIKPFCISQPPHKSVNVSFTITNMENKLTDLCGKRLLKKHFLWDKVVSFSWPYTLLRKTSFGACVCEFWKRVSISNLGEEFQFKSFWQWRLLHECLTITYKYHAM